MENEERLKFVEAPSPRGDISEADAQQIVDSDPASEASDAKFTEIWGMLSSNLIDQHRRQLRRQATRGNLPDEVVQNYEELEFRTGVKLDDRFRKLYYDEFCLKAAGLDTLHASEVEFLIHSKLGLGVSQSHLQGMIRQKALEVGSTTENALFDFHLFASTVIEILRTRARPPEHKAVSQSVMTFKLPIDPESFWKQAWDVLCLLLLFYCSFSVPFTIAFDTSKPTPGLTSSDISDLFIDSMFMIDIALSFVTAFEEQGTMVTDLRTIAINYFKTWFWPDLAGSFPFDIVITDSLLQTNGQSASNLVGMKFIRMLKLIRAVRFVAKLNKLKHQEGLEVFGPVISLVSAVFLLIFSAHMLGCFFTLFIASEPGSNWMEHYNPDLLEADEWVRYVTALYWAIITLTTMGYGDITPVTNGERLFVIAVALFGAVIFSYTMGTVSSLISQVAGVDDRFQERLRSVVEYLQFREAPPDLRRKVKNYYNHCWRRSAVPYEEREILEELTTPLRSLMLTQIGVATKHDVPIFQGFDDECIGFLVARLKRMNFAAGDLIYEAGDIATEMYLVVQGTVRIELENASELPSSEDKDRTTSKHVFRNLKGRTEVGRGESFGELSLFPDILGGFRPDTAVASAWGYAYTLSVDQIPEITKYYPQVVSRLRQLCQLKALVCKKFRRTKKATTEDQSSKRCTIRMCVDQLKTDLVHCMEAEILMPAVGAHCDVMKLMRPVYPDSTDNLRETIRLGGNGRAMELQHMSCVISPQGELLCIDHTVEGLSIEHPKSLGFVLPGKSVLRLLSRDEVSRYGSWGKRQLLGCTLLVFDSSNAEGDKNKTIFSANIDHKIISGANQEFEEMDPAIQRSPVMEADNNVVSLTDNAEWNANVSDVPRKGTELMLFTWSHEDFAALRKGIRDLLSNASTVASSATPTKTSDSLDSDNETRGLAGIPIGSSVRYAW